IQGRNLSRKALSDLGAKSLRELCDCDVACRVYVLRLWTIHGHCLALGACSALPVLEQLFIRMQPVRYEFGGPTGGALHAIRTAPPPHCYALSLGHRSGAKGVLEQRSAPKGTL